MHMEFLAGKSVNRSLGRHKCGLENDIKMDVTRARARVCMCECVCVCVCVCV